MRHGDWAWIILAAGVIGYELAAPRGELLSEAVDRYRQRHPYITVGAIAFLAAHLTRLFPQRFDPLTVITNKVGLWTTTR